jgi:hypothetical protein
MRVNDASSSIPLRKGMTVAELRTWTMPTAPANQKTKVKDRDGLVWQRPWGEPGWVDLWHCPNMVPMRWNRLLGERGPLIEVK